MKEKPFSKYHISINVVMMLWTIIIVLPFLLLFLSSITDETALVANGYSFFPKKFSLASYSYIIKSGGVILRAYGVSIVVTLVGNTAERSAFRSDGISAVDQESSGKKIHDVLCFLHDAVQRRYRSFLHHVDRNLPRKRYDFCAASSKLPAFRMERYDDSYLLYIKHSGRPV